MPNLATTTTITLDKRSGKEDPIPLSSIVVGTAFFGKIPDVYGNLHTPAKLWLRTGFGVVSLADPEYAMCTSRRDEAFRIRVYDYTLVKELHLRAVT